LQDSSSLLEEKKSHKYNSRRIDCLKGFLDYIFRRLRLNKSTLSTFAGSSLIVEAKVLENWNRQIEYPFKQGLYMFDIDPCFINFTISVSILTGLWDYKTRYIRSWRDKNIAFLAAWFSGQSNIALPIRVLSLYLPLKQALTMRQYDNSQQ
jgi:hypothetical protein